MMRSIKMKSKIFQTFLVIIAIISLWIVVFNLNKKGELKPVKYYQDTKQLVYQQAYFQSLLKAPTTPT